MSTTRVIRISGDGMTFMLRVNPAEITVTEEQKNNTIELLNQGECRLRGKKGLKTFEISTFLPYKNSPFFKNTETPEAIRKKMYEWKRNGSVVHVLVSGTEISGYFLIDKVSHTYKEGIKDLYCVWTFSEDVNLTGKRRSNTKTGKNITVRKETTVYQLAKKYYGDGLLYNKILSANKSVYSKKSKIKPGTKIFIPSNDKEKKKV